MSLGGWHSADNFKLVDFGVCVCVCVRLYRPSGSTNTVENASSAAVELWLSALSPDWRLLAALLSQFSHNHPE